MGEKTRFELAIEKKTGESVESIRKMPIDERRRRNEKKAGRRMRFISFFPFIGRGNVLRSQVVDHEEVESELDQAIK